MTSSADGDAPVTVTDARSTEHSAQLRRAARATYLAFGAAGFAFSSWAARIPQLRDRLHLEPASLGLVLLAVAAGAVLALPLAGPVVGRFGSRRVVHSMALLLGIGLLTVSLGILAGLIPVVIGLFVIGFANGAWDVAMNVQGAVVERLLGRSVMSRFHAAFSLGTVAGALVGAGAVALDVSVTVHLALVAVVVATLLPFEVRAFVPDQAEHDTAVQHAEESRRRTALTAWREPRTLLIGVFVLAFAFTEGVGNDWISVAVIDGYDAPAALGTLTFAMFLAAMTAGRWFGPGLLDRHGRVAVVRALAVVAAAGVVLFVFGSVRPAAFAGVLLWGAGASLGFPVGMSAGADDPRHAASRVSVIASIGYCAFLSGPPVVGFVGQHEGVLHALLLVPVLLVIAALVASEVRPPDSTARSTVAELPD